MDTFELLLQPTTLLFSFSHLFSSSCFHQTSSDTPSVHYLPSSKQLIDTVRNWLLKKMEHQTDIYPKSWLRLCPFNLSTL